MSKYDSTGDVDRIPRLDDSRIQWRDATSGKGRKIKIGTLKPDDSEPEVAPRNDEERTVDNRAKVEVGVGVMDVVKHNVSDISWPVGDNVWKTPVQRVTDILDISRYCLTNNSGFWYDYMLWITNTQDWSYTFWDESDDYYTISCYQKGNHWVCYDSDKPKIVKIDATTVVRPAPPWCLLCISLK